MYGIKLNIRLLASIALLSLAAVGPVRADDTEIYVSNGNTGAVRPNIMFIMDTSGSMNSKVPGTNPAESRIQVMQSALEAILSTVSNVNVGLMRYSANSNTNNGGPVLYPVSYIDGPAGIPRISSQVSGPSDDAVESLSTNLVNISQPAIDMVDTVSGTGSVVSTADSYQEGNSTNTCCYWATMGSEQLYFHFPNINIPAGATILSASVTVESNTSSKKGSVNIRAVDDLNPPLFTGSNMTVRSTLVPWNIPAGAAKVKYTSPDITSVIQDLVSTSGWASGNALALHFNPQGGGRDTCTPRFSNCTTLPVLSIVWSTGGVSSTDNNLVGLRFDNVNVPQGATITKAYIEFTASGNSNGVTDLRIRAQKSNASASFSATTGNISTRAGTTATVNWITPDWVNTNAYRTPDLSSLVQEVAGLPTWCGGPMTFLIDKNPTSSSGGLRRFVTYEGDPTLMPHLVVEFDDASAVGGCVQGSVVKQISTGNDDAEQNSSGSISLSGSHLNFNLNNWVGVRFNGINVPKNATILSAQLELVGRYNRNPSLTASIWGVDADDVVAFSGSKNNLSSRARTAPITWSRGGWKQNDLLVTPDLSALVANIVSRGGWMSGNNMAFLLKASSSTSSTGARSFNNSVSRAPRLRITYRGAYQTGSRTVRQLLKQTVSNFTAEGYTPISGTLYEAARYFRGEGVHYGAERGTNHDARFRVSHPASWTGGVDVLPSGCSDTNSSSSKCKNEVVTGTPTYISPIDDTCQVNHILFLSDGQPNAHNSTTANLIQGLTGQACSGSDSGQQCAKQLVQYMNTVDQASWLNATQLITTHTISFGSYIPFMQDLATAGGGIYSQANNKQDLLNAFKLFVGKVQDGSRTFVSAGVSVNQFNRLTHRDELYFSLFQPDSDTTWPGNLKRYRISSGRILDQNGVVAVDPNTGGFVSGAQSFWSASPDGDKVSQGGVAALMTTTRNVYTDVDGSNPNLTASSNRLNENNTAITQSMLGAVDASDRTKILQWARGLDVSSNASPLPARLEMGDPLHSRPVVVTYANGTPSGNSVVYVANNQGYLHAISAAAGTENWSFVPKDLLSNLTLFEKNAPTSSHVYGLDGRITVFHDDVNRNSVVDPGEKVILYVGMRRGGRNYYAIDVSDPSAPKIQFEIHGGTGSYAELGQTWSGMTIGKVTYAGSKRTVVVFGGGYDTVQDTKSAHAVDGVGRTVYMADALTGALLWNARVDAKDPPAGTSAKATMSNSIPGDVRAIDLTGSGLIEHIYAADTAGQVFRFDVNQANSGAADFAVGGRLAHLQGSGAAGNRRFYYSPDVAAIKRPSYKDFIAVSLGSGYRAHPLDEVVNERFYVLRDVWVLDNNKFPVISSTDVAESDLVDATLLTGNNASGVSNTLALIEDPTAPKFGWYIDFLNPGEKVLAESVTFNSTVIFSTYIPVVTASSSACAPPEGGGRAYVLNILDGEPKIDLNTDGKIDNTVPLNASCTVGDRCRDLGRGIPSSPLVIFEPKQASVCFGTTCYSDMLAFNGKRLQSIKWRRKTP